MKSSTFRLALDRLRWHADDRLRRWIHQHGFTLRPRGQQTRARLMREILVDHARSRRAAKRGGAQIRLSLSKVDRIAPRPDVNLIALDEALRRLEAIDTQKSRIVELRYFGGLGIEETAKVIGISPATVKRDWSMARAWLRSEIGEE